MGAYRFFLNSTIYHVGFGRGMHVPACVGVSVREGGGFYDFGSNYQLITDSDVWSGPLYYTTGTDICDLHPHFHSEWHWQSPLHPLLTQPPSVCVRECLFSICAASLFASRLPLPVSLFEMEAGVAYIQAGQTHCKWISHTHKAEMSRCQPCLRWWILMSLQHVFRSHFEGMWNYITPACLCVWAPQCFTSSLFH